MSILTRFHRIVRQYDWFVLGSVSTLILLSLVSLYSIDRSRGDELIFFQTQSIAFAIGLAVLFFMSTVHVVMYYSMARVFYIFAFFLLTAVLFFGATIRGTTGWFRFAGFSFQPAEFAKVALILFLGYLIQKQARRFDKWQFVVSSGITTGILAGLILLQPDLGSAVVISGIWFGVLALAGVRKRYMIFLVLMVVFGAVMGWFFFFQDYQKERVLNFLDPARDPLGAGYNVSQSMIAIGAGQLLGRGLRFASQSQLHFLPEAQTDFIFSVISEGLGFLAGMFVLTLYGILLWRLIRIAKMSTDDFSSYTVVGIALLFFIQIVINIGGTVGLLPVTGVTLPFLSYGGSSLIINLLLIGIVQAIQRSNMRRSSPR